MMGWRRNMPFGGIFEDRGVVPHRVEIDPAGALGERCGAVRAASDRELDDDPIRLLGRTGQRFRGGVKRLGFMLHG